MNAAPPPDTHARIKIAARKLFLRDGFIKTDVSRIVKEAQTSKREFYRYYSRREDAFLEAVRDILGEGGTIDTLPDLPPEQLLPELVLSFYKKNTDTESNGLFRASITASLKSSEFDAVVYNARAGATDPLVQRFIDWRKAGLITFNDPLLAVLRFAFLSTDGLNYIMGGEAYTDSGLAEHARRVTNLFLNGCASPQLRANPSAKLASNGQLPLTAAASPPVPEKRSRLSTEQWNAIYAAAWEEFRSNGFTMSSVETISRASGTPRSTIYRRHPAKIDLFTASVIKLAENIFPEKIEISSTTTTAEQALSELAFHIINIFMTPDNIKLHKILISESGQIPEETYYIYSFIKERFLTFIHGFFYENAHVFNFSKEDIKTYSWLFMIAATMGGRLLFKAPKDHKEYIVLSQDAARLFLFGVKAPHAAKQC